LKPSLRRGFLRLWSDRHCPSGVFSPSALIPTWLNREKQQVRHSVEQAGNRLSMCLCPYRMVSADWSISQIVASISTTSVATMEPNLVKVGGLVSTSTNVCAVLVATLINAMAQTSKPVKSIKSCA